MVDLEVKMCFIMLSITAICIFYMVFGKQIDTSYKIFKSESIKKKK